MWVALSCVKALTNLDKDRIKSCISNTPIFVLREPSNKYYFIYYIFRAIMITNVFRELTSARMRCNFRFKIDNMCRYFTYYVTQNKTKQMASWWVLCAVSSFTFYPCLCIYINIWWRFVAGFFVKGMSVVTITTILLSSFYLWHVLNVSWW